MTDCMTLKCTVPSLSHSCLGILTMCSLPAEHSYHHKCMVTNCTLCYQSRSCGCINCNHNFYRKTRAMNAAVSYGCNTLHDLQYQFNTCFVLFLIEMNTLVFCLCNSRGKCERQTLPFALIRGRALFPYSATSYLRVFSCCYIIQLPSLL